MRISVIGTINRDLIMPYQGAPIQSLGGIYYVLTALSQIGGRQAELLPAAFLGDDLYEPFLSLLPNHPNILPDGLIPLAQKNHKVILEYSSWENRTEKALFNFPPLEWEHLRKVSGADFFLVNMITGWDVSLKAVSRLSETAFEAMYLDVHFLVMGIDKLGKRFPRRPENIGEWLKMAKFVQMNEREFRIISETIHDEREFFHQYFSPEQILLITQGSNGADILFSREGKIRKKHMPAYRIPQVVDATGCGDVFGAAFVWEYLQNENIYQAADYANRTAAANALLKGTNEMEKLPSLLGRLQLKEEQE